MPRGELARAEPRWRARLHGVAAVVACLLVLPCADAVASVGDLTQKVGTAGCISNNGSGGACATGSNVGTTDVASSPDGANVYAVDFSQHSLTTFDRSADGKLQQKPGTAGCIRDSAAPAAGCQNATLMNKPNAVAVSPDGKHVYVTAYDSRTVTVFARASDGTLSQLALPDGCVRTDSPNTAQCSSVHGMGRPDRIVISPSGTNVYVAGSDGGNSVVALDRDPSTGKLAQLTGDAAEPQEGCISDDGAGSCQDGRALFHVEGLAISADGRSLYATSRFTDAIAVIDRDLATGRISQAQDATGCISETGDSGLCTDGKGLDSGSPFVKSPVVSPDGKNVYMPASDSDAVVTFARAANGDLTETGCISKTGSGGDCTIGKGLDDARDSDISPDGRTVYVGGATIAIFDRDTSTGALTQKPGIQGCVSDTGNGGACVDAFGDGGLGGVPAVSPDGLSLYTGMGTSTANAGIVVFDREPVPAPIGPSDADIDTIPDASDNCPSVPNRDQRNTDGDAQGDACDADDDGDGVLDAADACPLQYATGPDGCPPLTLTGVVADRGGPGTVTVTLKGTGLTGGPRVRLVAAGKPEITAGEVITSPGSRTLEARFDLAGKEVGLRDVVVSRGDRPDAATLKGAFLVQTYGGARLGAEVLGRQGVLGNYPATVLLQVTNVGNVDATNAIVRLDGFHTGADLDLLTGGASIAQHDDGVRRGAIVTFARIPARGSATALLRFTPVGAAHSVYRLTTTVLAETVPDRDLRPASDQAAGVTRQASASSATSEKGVLSVFSGSAAGSLSYALQFRPGAGSKPSVTAGAGRYVLKADIPKPGTGPPGAQGPGTAGDLELTLEGTEATFSRLRSVRDGTGNNAITAQRRWVADCLLARKYIDKDQHGNLNDLAAGGQVAGAVAAGLGDDAKAIATGRFATFAARLSGAWEAQLIADVAAAASRDPSNPFFKGKKPEEINGAVLELCRREDPKPNPAPPTKKPDDPPAVDDPVPPPPPPPPAPYPVEVFYPADPNDKVGPAGYGKAHYIRPESRMPYLVLFENKPDASAPAHEVRITDQLDASRLDLASLALGPVFFGADKVAVPPPGVQEWTTTVDMRPAQPLIVQIDAGLDRATGKLTWHLQGLNPETGKLETAPEIGFLPPNKTQPQGQGGVAFTVSAKPGLKTGDRIANGASIVFDRNEPIITPTYTNTIDGTAPTSRIARVRSKSSRSCRDLRVTFAGRDRGAGIAYRTVSVSRDGARYGVWRARQRAKTAAYRALSAGAYAFRSVAVDGVGYGEAGSGLWDQVVRSVRKRGDRLVLSLSRANARRLGLRGLRVTVDGRVRATLSSVPATVGLGRVTTGGHAIRIDGRRAKGGVSDTRMVAMCPKAPAR